MAFVIYAGIRSGGEGGSIPEAQTMEEFQQQRAASIVHSATPAQSKVKVYGEESASGGGRGHGSYQKVMKLIQEGVIKRIDEPNRLLYVNDPVWKLTTHERRDYTIRVVAEYLDWVSDDATGKLDVRSFRNGKQIARLNMEPSPVIQ